MVILLLLRPHFLRAYLSVVVDWTRAVRSLHASLLIIDLRVDTVSGVCVRVRVFILLIAVYAVVRRLPTQRAGEMRAVVATG